MCAHYQLKTDRQKLLEAFGIHRDLFLPSGDVINSEYFPGRQVPMIRQGPDQFSRDLVPAVWGIDIGKPRLTFNSRDDRANTVWQRFLERRVVIPLSMAIEPHYRSTPSLFGPPVAADAPPEEWALFPIDGSLAAVAGIAGPDMACVSMFTTLGTGKYAEVHNKNPNDPRMLAFLAEPEDVDAWLDVDRTFKDVRQLLRPAPDGWLAGARIQ